MFRIRAPGAPVPEAAADRARQADRCEPHDQDASHRARRMSGRDVPHHVSNEDNVRMRRSLLPAAVLIAVLGVPATAVASWGSPGSGGATSRALVMPAGNAPTVSVLGRNVTVS